MGLRWRCPKYCLHTSRDLIEQRWWSQAPSPAPRPSALPPTGPSLAFFSKLCYNLENGLQSPPHHRGLALTDGRGGDTTSMNTHLPQRSSHPACLPIGEAGRFVVEPLGRPTNFPSLAAAWFPRRAARWQDDSSCWLGMKTGLGNITRDYWNMHCCSHRTFLHNHPGGLLMHRSSVEVYVRRSSLKNQQKGAK